MRLQESAEATIADAEYRIKRTEAIRSMLTRPLEADTLTEEELHLLQHAVNAKVAAFELSEDLCRQLDDYLDYRRPEQVKYVLKKLVDSLDAKKSQVSADKPVTSEAP